jgi:XTP/dITP diphosphohydrolase
MKLLVATNNKGKLRELRDLLDDLPFELVSLSEFKGIDEIEETGSTFAENAALKAVGYAMQARLLTLADDSGLEVQALGNRPGVYSARYGGADIGFDEKMARLLDELEKTGDERRRARFVCSIVIASADGQILHTASGICAGKIAEKPRGDGGFGYDPIFVPDGFDDTFGELSEPIKQQISHRAAAFREIIPFLRDFIAF